jgi:DNA modification methylase
MSEIKLILGDCLSRLKELESNSVDSIVTDPPYGLSFMNQKWDYEVPSIGIWQECLRVLKPGGHLLSFAGSRTYHRMAVNIEDAGFDIRDQIMWVYGSGFPKSHNVALGIDKKLGYGNRGRAIPTASSYQASDKDRENKLTSNPVEEYKAKSEESKKWEGYGTALKPAHEPIVLARKPLEKKTVAENVLTYGTGAINIDSCRVGSEDITINRLEDWSGFGEHKNPDYKSSVSVGRFPANFIHDGSEEVLDLFPHTKSGKMGPEHNRHTDSSPNGIYGKFDVNHPLGETYGDEGSAARFFYCSKANKKDREENNNHPTVKPTDLMKYLIRLVTPKDGTVLDPFMGSGSTGKAAVLEGFSFIGIELSQEYYNIAEKRINPDITLNE